MPTEGNKFSIDGQSSPRYTFSGGVREDILTLQIDHNYGTRVRGFRCSFAWQEILTGRRCAQSATLNPGLEYQVILRLVDKRALKLEIKIKGPDGSEDRCVTPIRQIVEL